MFTFGYARLSQRLLIWNFVINECQLLTIATCVYNISNKYSELTDIRNLIVTYFIFQQIFNLINLPWILYLYQYKNYIYSNYIITYIYTLIYIYISLLGFREEILQALIEYFLNIANCNQTFSSQVPYWYSSIFLNIKLLWFTENIFKDNIKITLLRFIENIFKGN